VRLEALTIEAGAASLDARGLANANTSSVRVRGGVGDLTLGFDGVWTQDMALDASVALGRLTLLVPREIGIHISVTQVLGSLEQTGMEKRSDGYYSANWDSAKYRLRVKVQTVLGTVQVERTTR
jgi:predicted membrane protein